MMTALRTLAVTAALALIGGAAYAAEHACCDQKPACCDHGDHHTPTAPAPN